MSRAAQAPRRRICISIAEDVIVRVERAIYWTASHPTRSRLIEQGLLGVVAAMERDRGAPFPPIPEA